MAVDPVRVTKDALNDACEMALRAFLMAQLDALRAMGHDDIIYADEARRALSRLPLPAPVHAPHETRAVRGHLRLVPPPPGAA